MIKQLIKRAFLVFFISTVITNLNAQTNDDCLMCHQGQGLTTERHGKTISLEVNPNILKKSIHKKVACVSCHKDAAVTDFPHPENLKPVALI